MKKVIAVLLLLVASVSLSAAPKISQHQLELIANKWRNALRLNDWEVVIQAVHLSDLPEGTLGSSRRYARLRTISIKVLDPADYSELAKREDTVVKTDLEILADIKDTVVHELVHLRLASLTSMIEDSDDETMAEEVVVSRITSALLKLDTSKK